FHQDNGSTFLTGLCFKYSSTSFSSLSQLSSPKILSIKDLSKSKSFSLSSSSFPSPLLSFSSSPLFSSSVLALFSKLYISYFFINKVIASCFSVSLKRTNFLDLGSKRIARRPTSEDTDQYFFNDLSSASKNNNTNPLVSTGLKIFNFFFDPFSLISIVSAISPSGISSNSSNISFCTSSFNKISSIF